MQIIWGGLFVGVHYLASLGEAALIAFYLLDGVLLSYCWPQRISQ
jgi:hypothetical protein